MDANGLLMIDAVIGRSANRDVIALDAVILQYLLNGDTNRCAAAPECNDEGGFEAAADNLHTEFERVAQQRFGGDECLSIHALLQWSSRRNTKRTKGNEKS